MNKNTSITISISLFSTSVDIYDIYKDKRQLSQSYIYLITTIFSCNQAALWMVLSICLSHLFMPPPLGARGIMFWGCPSIRPSVRSLKYPLSTCTWVRLSIRPTVTVLRHVSLSVCPERFQGICRRTHGVNLKWVLKFCLPVYLGHL